MQGDKDTKFHIEEKGSDPDSTEGYIYTREDQTNYFLTPTKDGRIIAQAEGEKYPFRFVKVP